MSPSDPQETSVLHHRHDGRSGSHLGPHPPARRQQGRSHGPLAVENSLSASSRLADARLRRSSQAIVGEDNTVSEATLGDEVQSSRTFLSSAGLPPTTRTGVRNNWHWSTSPALNA